MTDQEILDIAPKESLIVNEENDYFAYLPVDADEDGNVGYSWCVWSGFDWREEEVYGDELRAISDIRQLVEKDKRIDELEAKIDALMLEHCPEELTTGQFDKWRDCQVISNSCARAALGDKDAIHELRKQAEAWKVEGLSEFKD